MKKVTRAVEFAAHAHDGMERKKDGIPYILHPMEAAAIVGTITNNEDVICAALLHDTVEDAGVTIEEIRELFGERVAELVASETEDKRAELPPEQTWEIRKRESLENLKASGDRDVLILWLGDKLSNIRSFHRNIKAMGDSFWESFNQKDTKKQAWYYRSILELTSELQQYPAWRELRELINIIFGKEEAYEA